jgi:acetoacetate decarboxylase
VRCQTTSGPRFVDREFLIITYRTDADRLREIVPEPRRVNDPLVHYEFIQMRDSTGFGAYTENGRVIPVTYEGEPGSFTLAMYLDDHPPISGGRELWGFPKRTLRSVSARCSTIILPVDQRHSNPFTK